MPYHMQYMSTNKSKEIRNLFRNKSSLVATLPIGIGITYDPYEWDSYGIYRDVLTWIVLYRTYRSIIL